MNLSPFMQVKIKDQSAQEFDTTIVSDLAAGPTLQGSVNLASNEDALGFVVAEIPTASKIATVKFLTSLFEGDTLLWSL